MPNLRVFRTRDALILAGVLIGAGILAGAVIAAFIVGMVKLVFTFFP